MDINQIDNIKKNPSFTVQIIQRIEKEIHRSINDEEEGLVVSAVSNIPNKYFFNYSIDQIMSIIKNSVIEEFAANQCEINNVDTHEIMKHVIDPDKKYEDIMKRKEKKDHIVEINVDSMFGYNDIATLVKKVNEPISSVNTSYILLDTRYRTLENDGTRYFSWGHMNQLTIAQGTINSLGNIRDIISMNIMPYKIPNIPSLNNAYDLITISVEEFIPQSIIAHENRRYHFLGCVDHSKTTPQWITICSDDYHKGEYKFNKPITSIDTITIKFGNPLEPISFDKDRLPGIITYGNPTIFNFTEPHNILTNDIVYIDTFNTINSTYDSSVISQINSIIGQPATFLTQSSISIPVDSTGIVIGLTGTVNPSSTILVGTVNAENKKDVIIGTGTSFITDFIVGDYINIQNSDNSIFQIKSIQSNTQLTLTSKYTAGIGNFTYRKTGIVLTGVGTLFNAELKPGDNIIINDGGINPEFIIKSIQSATELTLTTPYHGLDGAGFTFSKNNSISNTWSVFFSTKRIFIEMELTYLSS